MSTPLSNPDTRTPARTIDRAQYGFAAFLAVSGLYVVYDATTLSPAFSDQPVQPNAFPYVIGSGLVVLAGLLALATARGDVAKGEEGEDIDLTTPADWPTVAKLVGIFLFNVAFISSLGWAITGAILFAGTAWALGSTRPLRDLGVGVVLSVGTWYGFYVGLGIPIPAGILDGLL